MWVPQTKALYTGGSVNNFISGDIFNIWYQYILKLFT